MEYNFENVTPAALSDKGKTHKRYTKKGFNKSLDFELSGNKLEVFYHF